MLYEKEITNLSTKQATFKKTRNMILNDIVE